MAVKDQSMGPVAETSSELYPMLGFHSSDDVLLGSVITVLVN
jgi:hypothetical protein